jgi:glycogen synthase
MPSRWSRVAWAAHRDALRLGARGRRTGNPRHDRRPARHPEATGFLFDEVRAHAFAGRSTSRAGVPGPELFTRLQVNGMSRDYSWRASATHYLNVHRGAAIAWHRAAG